MTHQPREKLQPFEVREIYRRHLAGDPTSAIADDYDVSIPTVYWIQRGWSWADTTRDLRQDPTP